MTAVSAADGSPPLPRLRWGKSQFVPTSSNNNNKSSSSHSSGGAGGVHARRRKPAAFAIVHDRRTHRVLVVQDARTKKWMLPGGEVERNETLFGAACREMEEESGYKQQYVRLPTQIWWPKSQHVAFFRGEFDFNALGPKRRHRIWRSRSTPRETSDFGFVARLASGRYEVQQYDGTPKASHALRGGMNGPLDRAL